MQPCTYYLISSHGIDVIIIPELDCRLVVMEQREYWPLPGDVILSATIENRALVFRAVKYYSDDLSPLLPAIRWYALHVQYPRAHLNVPHNLPAVISTAGSK